MHYRLLIVALALIGAAVPPASAQVSVGIGISAPGVRIGIDVPAYPELVRVPQYPVYYAPALPANYFFYDGLYWVYVDDVWYSSSWYNGPWMMVRPEIVPVYVLRVPVRYYRAPPPFFRAWAPEGPPRWDAHWGPGWAGRHRDWMRADPRSVPAAPLPVYQRQYAGGRYPDPVRQHEIREQQYRFHPRDPKVQQLRAQVERPAARRADERRAAAPAPVAPRHDDARRPPERPQATLPREPGREPAQSHARQRPEHAAPHQPARERAEIAERQRPAPNPRAAEKERGPGQGPQREAHRQERREEGRGG